ncbi:MAG: hypothetical protein ACYTFI_23645, partial [Planctomycetota bacterium]
MDRDRMIEVLVDAYAHPAARRFFYSANGAKTASERLNRMECWDWTPERSIRVEGSGTCMFPIGLG